MSGIHVLSDNLKGGNKLEKTSTPKGKGVSDSPENAAEVFAAMFSGFMNLHDSKGQNSKADLESEEQSGGNPVQGLPILNGQGSMLGYGDFALSNLFQPLLESGLPAGKEANSGNDVSQKTGGLAIANALLTEEPIVSVNNLEVAMLKLVSLVSDEVSAQSGMTKPKPQGDNPVIMELDKYRQVIANLLVELSGEITDPSLKGNRLSLDGAGTMNLRQEMAKIVQGWMASTDEDANNAFALSGNVTGGPAQAEGEVKNKTLHEGNEVRANSSTTLVIDRLEALIKEIRDIAAPSSKGNPVSMEGLGVKDLGQDSAKIVQVSVKDTRQVMVKMIESWMTVTDEVIKNGTASTNQKGIQPLLDVLFAEIGSGNPAINQKVATLLAALNPFLRQGTENLKVPNLMNEMIDVEGSILAPGAKVSSESFMKPLRGTDLDLVVKQVQDPALHTNIQQKSDGMGYQKGDSLQSTELSGVKDVSNNSTSISIGPTSTLVAVNVADGKTIAIPVWEQISTVIREQVRNRSQDLKQLDIQLHPADLGKIQIGMRWENGLVHLIVQASEAATGQLLQNQLSDLRQNLTNQGVNCGMLQMGQGGERQQNPRGNESQRSFNQNTDPSEGEDQSSVINSLAFGQGGINRINVMA